MQHGSKFSCDSSSDNALVNLVPRAVFLASA